ncbi:glycosyl transferase [Shewanella sp. 10N.286.51.B2]|uniref:glycosyl transferase n=1 Tax=Shewanella sp. 10N.286.51.B2 TaxID=3229707 RepID=UPI00354C5781
MIKKIVRLINKLNASSNVINNLDGTIDFKIKSNYYFNLALTSSESLVKSGINDETGVIVSLTTYDKRIHDVHLVIESIGMQTVKPDKIVLWLDENEFSLETIPLILHKQIERGLEVCFCPNYRSYKKLIPTLQKYPGKNIITIDDDVLYPYDLIEGLVREHKLYPDCIISYMVHSIILDNTGKVKSYADWMHDFKDNAPSYLHVPIGVGGVFYPSGLLSDECLNVKEFTKLAPAADDIWFKAMSLINNVKCKRVNDSRTFNERFLSCQHSQDIALSITNVNALGNDGQIKAVFEKYNVTKMLNNLT